MTSFRWLALAVLLAGCAEAPLSPENTDLSHQNASLNYAEHRNSPFVRGVANYVPEREPGEYVQFSELDPEVLPDDVVGGRVEGLPLPPPEEDGPGFQELAPPLTEPAANQYVMEITPGTDPAVLAAELELVFVEMLTADVALMQGGLEMVLDINDDPRVVEAQENDAVYLTHGEDLVFGFYEGWIESEAMGQPITNMLGLSAVHGVSKGGYVTIAVLDTGADAQHPMLRGKLSLLHRSEEMSSIETWNNEDDDGDGDIDEGKGHGTVVAGLCHLVAPKAKILPIRVLNSDGVGSLADLIKGIDLAVRHGADIINMSLSLSATSSLLESQLQKLVQGGVVPVCAAGNQSLAAAAFPASSPNALGVSATDTQNLLASFSNFGVGAYVGAPGVDLVAPYPGNGMVSATGTSMATPVVSAAIALVARAFDLDPVTAAVHLLTYTAPIDPIGATTFGTIDPVLAIIGDEGTVLPVLPVPPGEGITPP